MALCFTRAIDAKQVSADIGKPSIPRQNDLATVSSHQLSNAISNLCMVLQTLSAFSTVSFPSLSIEVQLYLVGCAVSSVTCLERVVSMSGPRGESHNPEVMVFMKSATHEGFGVVLGYCNWLAYNFFQLLCCVPCNAVSHPELSPVMERGLRATHRLMQLLQFLRCCMVDGAESERSPYALATQLINQVVEKLAVSGFVPVPMCMSVRAQEE